MKISTFLKIKTRPVVTIGPDEIISIAIQKLVNNNIGALPVCNDAGVLLGIISERDLLKQVFSYSSSIGTIKVKEVMVEDIITATPEEDLDYVANSMRQNNVRHIPIVIDDKLQGIIAMRDIVNRQLIEAQEEIQYLKSW